ncbi:MAG: hypothetical protein A2015_09390 [Spirochaetes bacterium GWF1_31_7]|nr:MAG: hypothetical protein A2Y30_03120 [Spirochaetes bacterium GWE1_32_154]OHD48322.1 MAG: hypothetical protein A2Y29_05635 [Spirochaetes bacterium GWE2_31_10]OHD53014.1 MAG: hypothetical protein A2015_09390 [Spirochaetes bacterium GWF1_31_7]OHD80395.1 MAG: hypothetical protein A2355_13185 [Spirochaetes bacterium RIFOXYB1_FULL_32_8]HBD95947.1 hypothetical protein [Spirochaetia bacterium]
MKDIFPLTDPIVVLFFISLIILFVPVVFYKIKLPSLVGLIIVGAIVGPLGFNLLLRNSAIIHFGTVGLLYIMFISGLETDLSDFKKNKHRSIVFGLLTFAIPMFIGTLTTLFILRYNLKSSVLLASMYASHTLIAYPIISKMKLSKNQAVTITVGGTIITNILSLLILSVIATATRGTLDTVFWIMLGVKTTIFLLVSFFIIPGICRWFFHKIENQGGSQFIFVLSVIFGVSFLAKITGIEPIIGAFIAGIILNEFILPESPLLDKLTFTGNTIFIPYFLISVGMLIDVRVLVSDYRSWVIGITMVVVATLCKYIAALLTQKIFSYSREERFLMFGLSNAQAASTLAAVMVGYELGIFDIIILNGTIFMIMVTIFVSTYITDRFSRKIARRSETQFTSDNTGTFLISIANPVTAERLLDTTILLSNKNSVINALSIVNDDYNTSQNIISSKKFHDLLQEKNITANRVINSVIRVDINVAGGIIRASKELQTRTLVVGQNRKEKVSDLLFGSMMSKLIDQHPYRIIMCNIKKSINSLKKVYFFLPIMIQQEYNFIDLFNMMLLIPINLKVPLQILCGETCRTDLAQLDIKIEITYSTLPEKVSYLELRDRIQDDELLILFTARKESVSWSKETLAINDFVKRYFTDKNIIQVYPDRDPEIKETEFFE